MENRFMKFINEHKKFVVFYLLWSFLHLILLFNGGNDEGKFWPFGEYVEMDDYNFFEFFVYMSIPVLIFIINKIAGKDIKKFFEKNK